MFQFYFVYFDGCVEGVQYFVVVDKKDVGGIIVFDQVGGQVDIGVKQCFVGQKYCVFVQLVQIICFVQVYQCFGIGYYVFDFGCVGKGLDCQWD